MFFLARLSFKAFNLWDSFFPYSITKLIVPFMNIIIFYYIGSLTGNAPDLFALRGVLIVMLNIIVTDSIVFIQSEKRFRTLTPVLIAPINKVKLYTSRVVINYFHGLLLTSVYFIFVSNVFSITFPNGGLIFSILHLIGLSIPLQILAILVGFAAILVEEVAVLTLLFQSALLVTSGLFHDINVLHLKWFTPIRFYIERIDAIIAGQVVTLSDYRPYFIYILIYLGVGLLVWKPIEALIYKFGAKEE